MVEASPSRGARAVARCDALGVLPYSDTPDGLYRAWLTPAFAHTQDAIAGWMREAGMAVRIDPATNLTGRYDGSDTSAPALLIGSHIDSVRQAGRYDGPLGVMLGIELVAALHAEQRRLPFAIEVIAFGDEEGSRFPSAMLTSRAVAGSLDSAMLELRDAAGTSVAGALGDFRHPDESGSLTVGAGCTLLSEGLAFAGVTSFPTARRDPAAVLAYLEAHIEQGPVLESENLPLGIVTGIAAQRRYRVTVSGTAGHAGTTSMPLRRDALAAAAEMVLAVERIARDAASDLVATVGVLAAAPGAANVIPGRVDFTIDVRAGDAPRRDAAAEEILDALMGIADTRNVAIDMQRIHDLPASPCDAVLMDLLDRAVQDQGVRPRRLVSGAGHDAMVMAALCPTAMLFVRCAGGISHNPAEAVDPADVELALGAMLRFVDLLGETV